MKYSKNIFYVLLVILLILLLISCQEETVKLPGPATGDEIEIAFKVVAGGEGSTRAMTNELENKINEIDILVFKHGYFQYMSQAYEIEDEGPPHQPNYKTKTFKIKLLMDDSPTHQLVVIANAHQDIIDAESRGGLQANQPKDDLLKQIVFENYATDGRWPANLDGTQNMRLIPMSGESGKTLKITEALKDETPIPLYRALARIDVKLGPQVNNFELTHLYIYRYNRKGCVAIRPDPDWMEHPHTGEPRVRKVTLPDDPETQIGENGYLEYDLTKNNSIGSIYLLESEKVEKDDFNAATCLIVGGKYEGNEQITYYRIDFTIVWIINEGDPEGPPTGTSVNVEAGPGHFVGSGWNFARMLRNHVYEITIKKVTGPGKETLQKARGDTEFTEGYIIVKSAVWGTKWIDVIL